MGLGARRLGWGELNIDIFTPSTQRPLMREAERLRDPQRNGIAYSGFVNTSSNDRDLYCIAPTS